MEILACPVCKGELTLTVGSESDDEIIEGSLRCDACGESYPISEGSPNLLPPEMRRAMEAESAGAQEREAGA
jgi:uncharacterized protein YbaR (Trm112 family)